MKNYMLTILRCTYKYKMKIRIVVDVQVTIKCFNIMQWIYIINIYIYIQGTSGMGRENNRL